jgi:hypothetical protein
MKPQAHPWVCRAHDAMILCVPWGGMDEAQRVTASLPHFSAGTRCRIRLDATP